MWSLRTRDLSLYKRNKLFSTTRDKAIQYFVLWPVKNNFTSDERFNSRLFPGSSLSRRRSFGSSRNNPPGRAGIWGVISANINFQILLCHSPMLLCSFLRNSYMHVRILLFPSEFCYSLFWFYYAIMNSFIQFRILLFAFKFCYAVVQFCNSIVQFSHAVSNPNISFPILLFTFPILYANINSVIQFPILLFAFDMFFQIQDSM